MINLALIVLVLALIANLLLALLVIFRDPKSATNKLFFVLVLSMSIWGTLSYLSYKNTDTLLLARMVLFTAVVFATFFFLFVATFPSRGTVLPRKTYMAAFLWSVFVMLLTLTPLCFSAIEPSNNGGLGSPVVGPGIGIFGLTVGFYDIGGVILLARKTFRSRGEERAKRLYLWVGVLIMLGLILLSQFIFPTFFSNTTFIPYATVFILPFIAFTSYAIVKHQLLDIRAAATRGLAYALSLGFIGVTYGVVVFVLTGVLPEDSLKGNTGRLSYIALALVTAVVYPTVKNFFDSLTKKVFYRDAYDPQLFIDQLNKVFVSNAQLENLLQQTNTIIINTLKSEYSTFLVNKTAYDAPRWIGDSGHELDNSSIELLNEFADHLSGKVIVSEYLDANKHLRSLLLDRNIAILVRLVPSLDYDLPGIGYLVLGQKKSGNLYTSQDLKILEIIANELVIAVENALRFEEIEKFTITLQEKVDKATKELRDTNKKLIDLDEAKDEFISMASHQLRTPLTSMKGYVSMVLEEDSGKINDMQRKLLDQAFVSSQRMVYLIADLLNVSRLKTGKFIIEGKPTDLGKVVEEEVSQLVETAKSRNLELTYDKPKDFPLLMLDETKIRQVIMNFTDNAIYYTPAGGHIHVYLEDTGQTIECRVEDDGLGVPKAEQHHLFTKFYRAGNAKKARPDGTGLGLFMAKKVIAAQGGTIIFRSTEGKGSTFGFSFSKAKLKPTPEQLNATAPTTTIVAATDAPETAPEPKDEKPPKAKK